jgi:hypothetical protein
MASGIYVLARGKSKITEMTTEEWLEILKARSKRKYDRPEAFTVDNEKINGGNGNGNHNRLQENNRGQVRANQTA